MKDVCQIFGFSSKKGIVLGERFAEFRIRGRANPHAWGVAVWPDLGHGPLVVRDPRPAHTSLVADMLAASPIKLKAAVCHVRFGTTSDEGSLTTVTNAHPFVARTRGRDWAFAHNGFLRGVLTPRNGYVPHGTTDSEAFFARLVNALALEKTPEAAVVARVTREFVCSGKLNFLLSDGKHFYFFTNSGNLYYKTSDETVFVATEPVGDGAGWLRAEPGRLYVAVRGRIVGRVPLADGATFRPKPKKVPVIRGLFEEEYGVTWDEYRGWLEAQKGFETKTGLNH